ncbi:hypothetical protein [Aeromonas sp. QDB51]|uniref:hypothetical protein n=1 Tax=Aeromonas sp. QDB51 TaxID=2989827 RepID=UPI0022E2DE2D|nr:hypothetical protein [Aeromonas sp. QDB51]
MVRFSVLLMTASLIISPAYAVPNIWKGEFGQGFLALNINNESGDEFTIMCDLGYTETGEKTSASFRLGNGNDLSPSSKEGANKSYGTRAFTGNPLILND